MFFQQAPLFRMLLPFVAGILVSIYSGSQLPHPAVWLGFSLVVIGVLHLLLKGFRARLIFGGTTVLLLFVAGFLITQVKTEIHASDHFSKIATPQDQLVVEIREPLLEKERTYRIILSVLAVQRDTIHIPVSGKMIAYLHKDAAAARLQIGDQLVVPAHYNNTEPPKNPGEFNYQQYLSFHQIHQQAYYPDSSWTFTGINQGNPILMQADRIRKNMLAILRNNGMSGNEYAVASALILGYKADLDKGLVRAYSSAGATHVLAVSGLHVGIIFLLLNAVLKFLDRGRKGKILKAILLILCIWAYALITGLSPSVMRASTMFSFIIVGGATKRFSNIYNTLAASAIFLLLLNPFLVMQVGFQLSYLAVLGIVLLQPPLYQLIEPKSWLLDKIWAISAVSISAQIATFPLGLLYFHQFPNYFLVSNLLVIPLASCIIHTGILVFCFSGFPAVSSLLTQLLSFFVELLNTSVGWIESMPYSILEGIDINILETWMLYAGICCVASYSFVRNFKFFVFGGTVLVLLLSYQIYESIEQEQQQKIIVYNVSKHIAVDFIQGKDHVFVADSALAADANKMLFHVCHNWWMLGLNAPDTLFSNSELSASKKAFHLRDNLICFGNKTLAFMEHKASEFPAHPMPVDYLVICKNPRLTLHDALRIYQPQQIIIDGSNSGYKTKKWLKEAQDLQVPAWSVKESGAFIAAI